jgi:hypothetical protein
MATNNLTSHPRPPIIGVWVDQEIGRNDAHQDTKQSVRQLSPFIERWDFFVNPEEFYEFLDDNPKTQIFVIMSGRTAQAIVPARHNYVNIHSMYIYCGNVTEHRRLKDEFDKVKDVMNMEEDLYKRIVDTLSELLINIGESCVQSRDRALARLHLDEALRLMRDKLRFRNDHGRIRRANDLLERLDTWTEV